MANQRMRFLCFGMGAIGTYIGGSLQDAGDDVVFIERPESIQTIQKDGIRLATSKKIIHLPEVRVVPGFQEALCQGPFDIAILAIKSFDTANLLNEIRQFSGQVPPILCLQNGVENEGLIESALGIGNVIGGSVTSAVSRLGIGNAVVEKFRGVGIEADHPLSASLIDHFNQAGLNAVAYPQRIDLKWSKMLTNLQANATSAILDWTPAQVFSNHLSYHVEVLAMREAVAVMQRIGARVINLPGTPVTPWVKALVNWPEWLSRPLIGQLLGKGRGAKMPSFHIDLTAGRKQSEVVFLNGAVVRFGQAHQVLTPVNRVLTETLTALASGDLDRREFAHNPKRLLERIRGAA